MSDNLTPLQLNVLAEIRKYGKHKPITGADLTNLINFKSWSNGKESADIRGIINVLRMKKYPICASGRGYWWPRSNMELSAYIVGLDNRAVKQLQVLNGLKASFEKIDISVESEVKKNTVNIFEVFNPLHRQSTIFRVPGDMVENFVLFHPGARRLN